MDMAANLSGRQKAIVGLTVATALIHIVLGVMAGGTFLIIFLLNGLGYLALLAALYFLPQFAAQRGWCGGRCWRLRPLPSSSTSPSTGQTFLARWDW
ncbi:MAG: hypothetical protein IPJ90_02290 [Anaerolineaceae bacterium]|nr:hypothetical protein [Anaerolineaceae bacterium]